MDPGFGSFFKLLEVGFFPTWVLFPFFSTFRCFGWFEAVRGRLIGPKTWDRTCGIFWDFLGWAMTAQNLEGPCDVPKPGGPLTTRQPAEYS